MVYPVCSPDKTESYPSFLPYFQRSKSLPVLYCCLSCQHIPELLILIYKTSEYVLEQSNQTKIPKHRVRTKTIGANQSISILHGSRILNLWKRSNLKSKIKFGLEFIEPLFHLISLYLTLYHFVKDCYMAPSCCIVGYVFSLVWFDFFPKWHHFFFLVASVTACFLFLVDAVCITCLSACCFN